MTKFPRTKNYVNDREFVLVSPKTGMLLHVLRGGSDDGYGREGFDAQTKIMQEIVDHMNKTMGLDE